MGRVTNDIAAENTVAENRPVGEGVRLVHSRRPLSHWRFHRARLPLHMAIWSGMGDATSSFVLRHRR